MNNSNNLRTILNQNKESISLLEQEINHFENLDLSKANTALEEEVSKLNKEAEDLRNKINELSNTNIQLRDAIYSKLYSEKLSFITNSKQRMEAYFSYGQSNQYNRLLELENYYQNAINEKMNELQNQYTILNEEFRFNIASRAGALEQELFEELSEEVVKAKNALAESVAIIQEMNGSYEKLIEEGVTEQDLQKMARYSNWERFLGLSIINKIGMGLIILGVIFATQYTYDKIGDGMRAILIFIFGAVLIGAGEFLSRKKADVFSISITSGGIAVTYIALAVSYFFFKILPLYPAALLCVVITVGSFLLSIRHKSQVIATFALIGGFLPLMILDVFDETLLYSAMAYFLLLAGFALVLSFRKKWIVTAFFGLSLNIITTFILSGFYSQNNTVFEKTIFIMYITMSFISYTLIPIIGTLSENLNFKKSDITLIAINTLFSTVILNLNFQNLISTERDIKGLIPLMFMLVYIGLGQFLKKKMPAERDMRMLFFITAVTFFVLIIPVQFDITWLTLGWLVQGIGLSVYGILNEKAKFSISGMIINAFCLIAFLLFDLIPFGLDHFMLKYSMLTLGSVILVAAYAYKKKNNTRIRVLKYLTTIYFYIYIFYMITKGVNRTSAEALWISLYMIPIIYTLSFAVQRIKPIMDKGILLISHIMYYIGLVWLIILNFGEVIYEPGSGQWIIAAIAFAFVNITSLIALSDILNYHMKKTSLRAEWFPFLLSLFFTFILTQNLIVFYNIPFAGMTVSIIYVILAFIWCIFGFWKRFAFMRRFGLAMALLVVTKLFLIDGRELTEGYRIISYFALGMTLIGISFIYQHFTKKLEK